MPNRCILQKAAELDQGEADIRRQYDIGAKLYGVGRYQESEDVLSQAMSRSGVQLPLAHHLTTALTPTVSHINSICSRFVLSMRIGCLVHFRCVCGKAAWLHRLAQGSVQCTRATS